MNYCQGAFSSSCSSHRAVRVAYTERAPDVPVGRRQAYTEFHKRVSNTVQCSPSLFMKVEKIKLVQHEPPHEPAKGVEEILKELFNYDIFVHFAQRRGEGNDLRSTRKSI